MLSKGDIARNYRYIYGERTGGFLSCKEASPITTPNGLNPVAPITFVALQPIAWELPPNGQGGACTGNAEAFWRGFDL